jgi:hypothetical protein
MEKFGSGIRDGKIRIRDPGWKNSDSGSGINIPDPQRCKLQYSISPGYSCLACRDRWTGAFSSSPLLSPATTTRTTTARITTARATTATTIVS